MKRPALWWSGLWLATVATALIARRPWPVDETRYLGVAWDMWTRGDLLVPRLNGAPYTDKPPLLFWLFQAGWAAFGVNAWWPRLVPPLFGLLCLSLTARIARRLWPDRPEVAAWAPLMLGGALLFTIWSTLLMFDLLVVAFTLAALLALLAALDGGGIRAWLAMGLALGLGLLAKGPVLLMHVLPAALLAPLWSRRLPVRRGRLFGGLLLALGVGVAIALLWVVPASLAGGPEFRDAILFGQIRKRIAPGGVRLHDQPFWYYAAILPVMLFPWPFWPRLWRAAGRLLQQPADDGRRFCACWALASLLLLSVIASKQEQYLLPLLPALALLGARALAERPDGGGRFEALAPGLLAITAGVGLLLAHVGWLPHWDAAFARFSPAVGVALCVGGAWLGRRALGPGSRAVTTLAASSSALVALVYAGIVVGWAEHFDVQPAAQALAALQAEGIPTAVVGEYRAEYQFAGRLQTSPEPIEVRDAPGWAELHPDGVLIDRDHLDRYTSGLPPRATFADDTKFWDVAVLAGRLRNQGRR